MSKYLRIAIAIVVPAFILTNFYLLYSKESVIPKVLYVDEYKRVEEKDYKKEIIKESLVAPAETHTIYVGDEGVIESWLVQEGDEVFVGQELATLSTARADHERNVWETERTGLIDQQISLEGMRDELESLRYDANSQTTSNVDRNQHVTEIEERAIIEFGLDIGLTLDVTQEGAYTQAISAIDQQLSDIDRQLTVLDVQLAQDDANPALISPVTGIVSNVMRHGDRLSIDIYDEEQIAVTYVDEKEWQEIEEGQHVKIQAEGLDGVVDGDVLSVSSVPMAHNEQLKAYQALEGANHEDQHTYYEVRILPGGSLAHVPYAANVNAQITVDEAYSAVAIPADWGRIDDREKHRIMKLDETTGRPELLHVTTPFTVKEQRVITDGLMNGDVVLEEQELYYFEYAPQLYLSFPSYVPKKEQWKTFGWRNYLKAMLVK